MAILKTNSEGLIPVELSQNIIEGVRNGSAIMSLSRLEDMKASTKKISVLEGVSAYFVGEGTKIGVDDDSKFRPVTLTAKKLAVIVPFSNELLNESVVDVISELKKEITEQFYRKFDIEAIQGTDSVFEQNLLNVINTAGKTVTVGATAGNAYFEDVSDTMALVEDLGYNVNGFVTPFAYKNKIRKMKDGNGNALFSPKNGMSVNDEFYGQPIGYSFGVDKSSTELITGDFQYSIVGLQGSIQYKLLQEATVGNYNLAEQDMSALRCIMPVAYAIAKTDAFAKLNPAASA